MTLENLFAQAAQCRTFLTMCLCGILLGSMLHLAHGLWQWRPWLGALGDLAALAGLACLSLKALIPSGEGLRGYTLLGLLLGATLYSAGLSRMFNALAHLFARPVDFIRRKVHPKAGNTPADGESIS